MKTALYGLHDLRVIDASILPEIPLINLNPTIIMMAENWLMRCVTIFMRRRGKMVSIKPGKQRQNNETIVRRHSRRRWVRRGAVLAARLSENPDCGIAAGGRPRLCPPMAGRMNWRKASVGGGDYVWGTRARRREPIIPLVICGPKCSVAAPRSTQARLFAPLNPILTAG